MAQILSISNARYGGSTTIDLMTDEANYANLGVDLGLVVGNRRMITISAGVFGTSMPTLWANVNRLLKLLLVEARRFRARGMGRRVELKFQPNGATSPTYYPIFGGSIKKWPDLTDVRHLLKFWCEPLEIELECEPYGLGTEATALSTGTLYGHSAGITHHFIHYSGATVFSVNMASVSACSMWQRQRLIDAASPAVATPQNGDILYFGNDVAVTATDFDKIVMGVRTPAVGTWTAVWEYWSGAAWSSFTPAVNNFNTTRDWDTACSLGRVSFPALAGWAATAINGVTAFWVRWRISAFTNMTTVPVRQNGMTSTYGLAAITAAQVPGDVSADALIHLTNPGATALYGAAAAIATGEVIGTGGAGTVTYEPPIYYLDGEGADLYAATGDNLASITADANASREARVDIALFNTLTDGAQSLTAGQYINYAAVSGDKIDNLGAASFHMEIMFKLGVVPDGPLPLWVRCDTAAANKVVMLWVEGMTINAWAYTSGGVKKTVYGSTTLAINTWYVATIEFDSGSKRLRLYLDTALQSEVNTRSTTLRTAVGTDLRIGQAVNVSAGDFIDSSVSTQAAVYTLYVSYEYVDAQTIATAYGGGGYPGKDVEPTNIATCKHLCLMNDNAGNTTILDASTTPLSGVRSAGNTNVNRFAGFFQTASGSAAKVLGWNLPDEFGEEHAGPKHVYLLASLASALATVDLVEFSLQLSIGDVNLGFAATGVRFPDITPTANAWYWLDLGPLTTAAVALYDGHRNSGSARGNLQAHLFIKYTGAAALTVRVDGLLFLPADTWWADYRSFKDTIQTVYSIAQNEGLLIDGTSPAPVISQTSTGGYTVQERNPYADYRMAGRPRLTPGVPAWLIGVPLRGTDATVDYHCYSTSDSLTPRVNVQHRAEALVAA